MKNRRLRLLREKRARELQIRVDHIKRIRGRNLSIFTLLVIMIITTFLGHIHVVQVQKVYAEASEPRDTKINELTSQNALLKEKLEASSKVVVDDKTKEIVDVYLNKYFGKDAPTARKIFTCESGLSPYTTHQNSDKVHSIDRGVAQLNDHWQGARFEKATGVKFEIGAHDIQMNLLVASQLFKEQGWSPWVCSRII